MNIAILGFGVEGKSAHAFLKKKYPTANIKIRDKNINPDYLNGLERFDLVVRSPGIKYLLPEIQSAQKSGAKISSSTKLFFAHAKGTIVGITGTKGKGTTASMLYRMLKTAGKDVYFVGNIGKPMLSIISKLKKRSIIILELSSFQLQDLGRSPHVAVVLAIAPDHLDYHKDMHEYVEAKSQITAFQSHADHVFYVRENAWSKKIAKRGRSKKIPIDVEKSSLIHASDVKILGHYNFNNAIVAAFVARHFGVAGDVIKKSIQTFKGLPYHLEFMKEVAGVRYINDSASTNPISTKAALLAITEPTILIAGGVDKNFQYGVLKPALKRSTKLIILYGASRQKIADEVRGVVPIKLVKNLHAAIKEARKNARRGDVVLFSPASASFDMFKNSKDRGEQFSNLVKGLR